MLSPLTGGPSVALARGCVSSVIPFFDLFECVRHVLICAISALPTRSILYLGIKMYAYMCLTTDNLFCLREEPGAQVAVWGCWVDGITDCYIREVRINSAAHALIHR